MTSERTQPASFNEWADYWRYRIGVNVIPADTKNKKTWIKWIQYQNSPVSEEQHKQWKEENAYTNGIAIIVGKVWHNLKKNGLYLTSIDLDNQKAIEEFCKVFGKTSLDELSEFLLVEVHKDEPNRAHIYCYTRNPVIKKSSDIVHGGLAEKIRSNEIPGFEVKGLGKHGISYCTPSVHENGHNYEIIGTKEPKIVDDLQEKINFICKENNICYFDNGNGKSLIPIKDLFKAETKVISGNNRHEAVLRIMESLIAKLNGLLPLEKIKQIAWERSNEVCNIPLGEKELERQWSAALKFIAKKELENNYEGHPRIENKQTAARGGEYRNNQSNKEIRINKYTGNGRLPLHESVIISDIPRFVTLSADCDNNESVKPKFLDSYGCFIPSGTIDTITPLPYFFASEDEFCEYLHLAKNESFDTLYLRVDSVFRKYVNVEEYYYPVLVGDTIWSYFQDRFPYTHYLVFTGDNGSGKNSALLVFRYLGYRVFYVVSASAANYWTAMGNVEEGQVSIAEDEVEDLGLDKDKRNILKSGYASGGTVPKTDTNGPNGRIQDNWLVYSHKWLAMEELKEDKYTKGVLHRSLKMKFLAGDVPYNIKDVLRYADDPDYKPLYEELVDLRKLLFCFRLLHYKDPILNIQLNVRGRTAELTSPLIRLFRNSVKAKEKIIESLSKFMFERSESMRDSFEAKLLDTVQSLIDKRTQSSLHPTEEGTELGPYTFTNETIREGLVRETEAQELTDKKNMYYSAQIGSFSQSKISSILKSKFKVKPTKHYIGGKQRRCVEFNQDYLDRIKASYDVPEKIEILTKPDKTGKTGKTAISTFERAPNADQASKEALSQLENMNNRGNGFETSNSQTNIYDSDPDLEKSKTS